MTGFGQTGPYAARPGFATLAEAMSGFAGLNGEPGGAPLLPPIALTDEVTALAAAFATMVAIHSGVGQIVDVSLLRSMLQMMGPLPSAAALLAYDQPRLGSGIPYSVPRGTFQTKDGAWVALSTSSEPVARRVLDLVGLGLDDRLRTSAGRVANREIVDQAVADWIAARTASDVIDTFVAADAAIAPVMAMTDVVADPHVVATGLLVEVEGVPMQGPVALLSETPGEIRWVGRPLGADTDDVLADQTGWRDDRPSDDPAPRSPRP